MKKLPDYFLSWELLLIPVVATLGFGVNLIYSSLVLTEEGSSFKEIRDTDFPVLHAADMNLNRYEAIVVALNTAAATGEAEFLDVAKGRAIEIQGSYEVLEKLDAEHKYEIEKLKSGFKTYFDLAVAITHQMLSKSSVPGMQQISKMRTSRDAYLAGATAYREAAENDFHEAVSAAINKSERARIWSAVIGALMLLVIIVLTWLVRRDITKRKLMETALRASAEASRIAATAFETHDAIMITDAQANVIRVNRAFSDITGYGADELLGKNPRIMSSGRHDRFFYIEMWKQLLHSGSWSGEIWDRRKNGEVYPKWMTITAVKNEQHETSHYVAIFSDITARKRSEEEIHNLAFYDALTKLPNRRLFRDRFQAALTASARRRDYGAVLFIDLDRFKSLNDTLGHDYGDLLLKEVSVRIKSCVREMDTAARFGGDEFVVLLDALGDDRDDAARKATLVAEKIREALVQPYQLKGHEHHNSPSIGVSLYHGDDESQEILLEHADLAMYQAKKSGRNTVRFFDHTMKKPALPNDSLVDDSPDVEAPGNL